MTTKRIPKEFIRHDGGDCPVDPEAYVEALVKTSQGIGSAGVMRAKMHAWNDDDHPANGVGRIVGYRLVVRDEPPHFHSHDRFTAKWP